MDGVVLILRAKLGNIKSVGLFWRTRDILLRNHTRCSDVSAIALLRINDFWNLRSRKIKKQAVHFVLASHKYGPPYF